MVNDLKIKIRDIIWFAQILYLISTTIDCIGTPQGMSTNRFYLMP